MQYLSATLKFVNIKVCWTITTHLKTPVHEILYCEFVDDGNRKCDISQSFRRKKTHYLGHSAQKLKAAHPVNYFPGFLGKNIKNYPPK